MFFCPDIMNLTWCGSHVTGTKPHMGGINMFDEALFDIFTAIYCSKPPPNHMNEEGNPATTYPRYWRNPLRIAD